MAQYYITVFEIARVSRACIFSRHILSHTHDNRIQSN